MESPALKGEQQDPEASDVDLGVLVPSGTVNFQNPMNPPGVQKQPLALVSEEQHPMAGRLSPRKDAKQKDIGLLKMLPWFLSFLDRWFSAQPT